MPKLLSTIFLFCLIHSASLSQTDDTYKETLFKMFEVSGTEATFNASMEQMFVIFKQSFTEVDPDIWSELQKEVEKSSLDSLFTKFIPVYQKYFTEDDLKQLISFYETPIGMKLVQQTPLVLKETMIIGQQWGMEIGENLNKRMKEKGY